MRRGRPVIIIEVARRTAAMWRGRRPVVIEVVARRGPKAMRGRRGPVEVLIPWRGRPSIAVGLGRGPDRREDEQGDAGKKCAHQASVHVPRNGYARTGTAVVQLGSPAGGTGWAALLALARHRLNGGRIEALNA